VLGSTRSAVPRSPSTAEGLATREGDPRTLRHWVAQTDQQTRPRIRRARRPHPSNPTPKGHPNPCASQGQWYERNTRRKPGTRREHYFQRQCPRSDSHLGFWNPTAAPEADLGTFHNLPESLFFGFPMGSVNEALTDEVVSRPHDYYGCERFLGSQMQHVCIVDECRFPFRQDTTSFAIGVEERVLRTRSDLRLFDLIVGVRQIRPLGGEARVVRRVRGRCDVSVRSGAPC
jgi:hypothetical protein